MLTIWSYALAGFVYAAFAIYLASGWRSGGRGRVLFVAASLCAFWGLAGLAFVLTENTLFLSGHLFLDFLRYGGWFLFLLLLLGGERREFDEYVRRQRRLGIIAVGILSAGIGSHVLLYLGIALPFDPSRFALMVSLGMSVFTLFLVEQLFRGISQDSRWMVKPICIGLGGAVLFDLYLYSEALLFNRVDTDAFSIRGFVHALALPLIAVSTARSNAWTKKVVLSQRAALQSASLVAVGIYLLFMAAAGYYVRYFGGDWGRAFQLAILFAGLLILGVLVLSGSMRAKFRVWVAKHFFSYRYDYREEWLRFTNTLASQDGFSELGRHVIRGLADMVESPAGALWLRDASGRFFAQSACWEMPVSTATEETGSPLCQFLINCGWVVNLEEYRSLPRRYDQLVLPNWLIEVPNAWLVVPLATGSDLIGFVVLATARARMDVNWEVNDLLKTAGRQAGAFLGQMLATEALLEARKFDAFNRMSAFVVHDLKNIIAQLSLMLKNAERHRDNPEFQKDMQMTVEHSVDRMRQLMMQLREGANPLDSPKGVDLSDVIRRIQVAKKSQGRDVDISVVEKLVAKGHEDRIERVIGHVVQNALDATDLNGLVSVEITREDACAVVTVRDTGHGMSPEFVRERLFKPFQTTKQAGMGIGAYESFQYINELGGKILVDSTENVGTNVRLVLPLFRKSIQNTLNEGGLQ